MTAPAMAPYAEGMTPEGVADPAQAFRDKLKKLRGANYPAPDDVSGKKSAYVAGLYEGTNSDALARYWQATKNLCYANGRQHITWSKTKKTWDDIPLLDPNELRVTMNTIRPILRAKTQRRMSAPIDFSVRPDSTAMEAKDRADTATRFFEARWRLTNMRAKLDQSLELADCCGIAAWKSFWNPDLGPLTPATMQQVRRVPVEGAGVDANGQPITEVVYDEQGQPVIDTLYIDESGQPVESEDQAFHYRPGDTDTAVRTVFNVRVNPEATGWTAGEGLRYVIDTEIVPLSKARELYPHIAEQIQAGPQTDSALTYERIAASAATVRPVATYSGPGAGSQTSKTKDETATIREYWELPSECFPKGRLITLVNDVVAYDDVFPQGVLPYAPIFDEPAPLTAYGRPGVNDMITPQDVINAQWTAIVAEMQLSGVGKYVTWDVEGIPDQLTASDQTVIKIQQRSAFMNKSLGDVFHRLEPAHVSPDRWRLIEKAESTLYDIGGFHEVTRGKTPPGVDSGVAIDALLEQEAGQLQKSMLALHESIVSWARQQLAIAQWGYGTDDERWLPVNREDLGFQVESITGKDLPDPQSITIELDNFKPKSETARRSEIKELFTAQLIGPRQALKALDMGTGMNAVLDSQSRHYARARNENLAIERGEFVVGVNDLKMPGLFHPDGVPYLLVDDDNHGIHMEVLDEIVLDDSKSWEIRQAAIQHKKEHRAVMQMMAQQQADAEAAAQQETAA